MSISPCCAIFGIINNMRQEITRIRASFQKEIGEAAALDAMERLRVAYLGRKGACAAVFDALKNMPPEEKRAVGEEANRLRREIETAISEKKYVKN